MYSVHASCVSKDPSDHNITGTVGSVMMRITLGTTACPVQPYSVCSDDGKTGLQLSGRGGGIPLLLVVSPFGLPGCVVKNPPLGLRPTTRGNSNEQRESVANLCAALFFHPCADVSRCMAVDKPSEDSMRHAAPSTASPSASCLPRCSAMMDSLVYLPLLNNIPDSEWDRCGISWSLAL